ncbi:3-phosphoshikimate 1-carboxyvinyltransferase [Pantoea sp. V108_6]|uniref:3-phosphoshikimate 1-carboxyvinyltransferase n=1 Tax=Pantoea sp. V108_6 TaxID=3044235 RepID=UPI00249F7E0A|nr:3-phosphoshikimate 1-carboxyvinyltransferase [Pantoea sp. V108_6]MDI3363645.1 3-phosphoshikimate 1-carboxyvinyltransferase [Pantoea sp. V108_6]
MKVTFSGRLTQNPTVIEVAGDKSISHRAVMLGSLAEGVTTVRKCLLAADVVSTIGMMRAMGVSIEIANGLVTIYGAGERGLARPNAELDAGNAGTAMRLMAGILAGQPFESVLVGDHSLSKRPMGRVATPLGQMGAEIQLSPSGTAPMRIAGTPRLRSITYDLPVASAQVKSAVLLAGLYADGVTTVIERKPTRNYTETMVSAFGGNVSVSGQEIRVERSNLKGRDVVVPGDISSAAFFMVAAAINPGASITIRNVGINPTRTGIVDALRLMGARVELSDRRSSGGEEVADITVTGTELAGIELDADIAPRMIDEFPVFFVAAAFANGTTVVRGAEELRVKESDRIETMLVGLRQLGVTVESKPDGAVISGVGSRTLKGGVAIETAYDHRIGMAFAIASSRCEDGITIVDAEAIGTSFPGFGDLCAGCGLVSSQ